VEAKSTTLEDNRVSKAIINCTYANVPNNSLFVLGVPVLRQRILVNDCGTFFGGMKNRLSFGELLETTQTLNLPHSYITALGNYGEENENLANRMQNHSLSKERDEIIDIGKLGDKPGTVRDGSETEAGRTSNEVNSATNKFVVNCKTRVRDVKLEGWA
jgi:hypothetical protein